MTSETRSLSAALIGLLVLATACTFSAGSGPTALPPTATSPPPTPTPPSPPATPLPDNMHAVENAQAVIDAVRGIQPGGDIPERFLGSGDMENTGEFEPEPGDFDPDAYFDVLTHLSMEPGHTLDYVYQYDGMGGFPILFATETQTSTRLRGDDYLEHVQADGSPEGYFELAALDMMGGQFYLWWHAGYNDDTPVATLQKAQTMLADAQDWCQPPDMPADAPSRLQTFDYTPVVTLNDETAEVRFIAMSAWGGFYEITYTLRRSFPHTILDRQTVELIEWECGIAF